MSIEKPAGLVVQLIRANLSVWSKSNRGVHFTNWQSCFGDDMTLQQFEDQLNLSTTEAASLLGLVYPRYMELRRGARMLKPYHVASMRAHALLSQKSLDTRLVDSRAGK